MTQSKAKHDLSPPFRICVYLCPSVVFFCLDMAKRAELLAKHRKCHERMHRSRAATERQNHGEVMRYLGRILPVPPTLWCSCCHNAFHLHFTLYRSTKRVTGVTSRLGHYKSRVPWYYRKDAPRCADRFRSEEHT